MSSKEMPPADLVSQRDFFMTAETAKDFGLVDKVINHWPEIPPLAAVC
jgi:ATP-dependent protease ClpP protease subunit